MIHELVVEVCRFRASCAPGSTIRHQLYPSELGVEESCVVAAKPIIHILTRRLGDTYSAEEAVFLTIGLDSNHPTYCLNHSFIFPSF